MLRLGELAAVLALCAGLTGAQAVPAWLPAGDIQPGARGNGLATFHGTEVTSYAFEVVDVLAGESGAPNALLVRVSGPAVEAAGGIAQGMSGSPLYLDGRLAAVLAYSLPDADPHYGYAMPFEYCLPLLRGDATPVAAALPALSGASEVRAVAPFTLSSSVALAQTGPPPALEPGALAGLQIVRGAMHATTYGTVTAVAGGRALLLGHKYLHEGACEYPLVRASVGAVIPSTKAPFLEANPVGEPIGTVVEDRAAGCVAVLGRQPRTVPLSLRVVGERATSSLTLQCAPTPEVFEEAVASSLIASADSALDRVGPGSAALRLGLTCGGGMAIDRREVVSSERDIGGACASELRHTLRSILLNEFHSLPPEAAEVELVAAPDLAEAEVLGCEVTPHRVRPGEEVLVTVRLRPYRQAPVEQQVRLRVPEGTSNRLLQVRVHAKSGGDIGRYDAWEAVPDPGSAAAYCQYLSRSGLRCTLACDLLVSPLEMLLAGAARGYDEGSSMDVRDVPAPSAPEGPGPLAALRLRESRLGREILTTPWVLRGEAVADLEVAGP
jgi:hypothetical protein